MDRSVNSLFARLALLLILSLAGCIARPICGWQGYTASALATAEAGVRYMDWRGDVVCVQP